MQISGQSGVIEVVWCHCHGSHIHPLKRVEIGQHRNELRLACWQWIHAMKIDGSHHYLPICLQMMSWVAMSMEAQMVTLPMYYNWIMCI